LVVTYHEKAPPQPDHLVKISYRSILNFLKALLDYEHRYDIKLELSCCITKGCVESILSRFNISLRKFQKSSVSEILRYLSIMCTPTTRQEMKRFLEAFTKSLLSTTKAPNITYFVNGLQDYRCLVMQCLEFIDVMPHLNFKKDLAGHSGRYPVQFSKKCPQPRGSYS